MIATHSVKMNGKWYRAGEEIPLAEPEIKKVYTKTEINRMSTAELQNLSEVEGIENAFETSGGELKKLLIEHFGL